MENAQRLDPSKGWTLDLFRTGWVSRNGELGLGGRESEAFGSEGGGFDAFQKSAKGLLFPVGGNPGPDLEVVHESLGDLFAGNLDGDEFGVDAVGLNGDLESALGDEVAHLAFPKFEFFQREAEIGKKTTGGGICAGDTNHVAIGAKTGVRSDLDEGVQVGNSEVNRSGGSALGGLGKGGEPISKGLFGLGRNLIRAESDNLVLGDEGDGYVLAEERPATPGNDADEDERGHGDDVTAVVGAELAGGIFFWVCHAATYSFPVESSKFNLKGYGVPVMKPENPNCTR